MDLVPGPGAWPLSAAATAVLRDPQTPPPALLRLTLRELVVRGVVRVHVAPQRGRRAPVVRLAPGDADAAGLPAPLRQLAGALAPHLSADGTPAHAAVRKATGWRTDLGSLVRQAARDELRTAGLLAEEHGKLLGVVPRTRWQPTPSGRAWARSAADAAAAPITGALPAAGLLLALDQDLQRRLRDASGGADVGSAGWASDDLDHLDAVLGEAGPALDSAVDGGSGGGDGGDGGGGD